MGGGGTLGMIQQNDSRSLLNHKLYIAKLRAGPLYYFGCVWFLVVWVFVVVFDEVFDGLKNNSYVICLDFKCCASVPTSHSDAWYFTW